MKTIRGRDYHKLVNKAQISYIGAYGFIVWERGDMYYARPVIMKPLSKVKGMDFYFYNHSEKKWDGGHGYDCG